LFKRLTEAEEVRRPLESIGSTLGDRCILGDKLTAGGGQDIDLERDRNGDRERDLELDRDDKDMTQQSFLQDVEQHKVVRMEAWLTNCFLQGKRTLVRS
jgi:hypothetical protein